MALTKGHRDQSVTREEAVQRDIMRNKKDHEKSQGRKQAKRWGRGEVLRQRSRRGL